MKPTALIPGIASLLFTTGVVAQPKNVVFIAVDDLRPELGCYGHPLIQSPNIDELAQSGTRFSRSYCNIAVCGASRASVMSGVRPGIDRFVGHDCYLDLHLPGAVSLPMHFRNNGYQTFSLGKVFHHQFDSKGSWDVNWHPQSESKGTWRNYATPQNIAADTSDKTRGMPYENANVPDEAYFDGKIAAKALEHLKKCAKQDKPFFMAIGFLKPHLPFNAPSKYWDLYPESKIHLPANMSKPENAPDVAMHNFGELRAYSGIPATGPVPDEMALKLIRGYYACVSYTDAQIGKVLQTLDELGIRENTIVVLWGDHGWHLGEHGLWCKHCNFEKVLHTPLIISAPGHKPGVVANQLVEYVDLYPTLCDLTGLVKPFQLQGNSLVPLLDGGTPAWKDAVFCRWVKGETVITQTHAYTEWYNKPGQAPFARMLYEHTSDPGENVNVSELPANKQLTESLHQRIVQNVRDREVVTLPLPVPDPKKAQQQR